MKNIYFVFIFLLIISEIKADNKNVLERSTPIIRIYTENNADITSKIDYQNAIFSIFECDGENIQISGKIRGRGNATWTDYPKKPYKIKLSEKESIFGFPKNKDWVLLAEYCDRSLMRTAYMSEVSKIFDMKYVINYQHVELYLNDEYMGIYLLTDQVEKGKDRVNIDSDGYLLENDNYYDREPLYFSSSMGYPYTFKYPNVSAEEIVEDDDNYCYIKTFIDQLEEKLLAIDGNNKDYLDCIDIVSFAKWFIVSEITLNIEPNQYYVLKNRESRLEMYPIWDAEWSFGLACKESHEKDWIKRPFTVPIDYRYWNRTKYFSFLFKDDGIRREIREIWNTNKAKISSLKKQIKLIESSISEVQENNFKRWPILGKNLSVCLYSFETWEEECSFVSDFFIKRVEWFDTYVNSVEFLSEISRVDAPVINDESNYQYFNLLGQPVSKSYKGIIIKKYQSY